MLLQQLYARLQKSKEFLAFREQNPDAFLCAGFFIMNFKLNSFEYALDYRNDKQIFTFNIPENTEASITIKADELIKDGSAPKLLDEITLDVQVDLEDLKEKVEKSLAENNIKNKLEEFIAILQKIDNQLVWHLTVVCEGFTILTIIVHSETGNIEKFDKKNIFDFVKKK